MPLFLSEVYDALLEAGASDAKARSAAAAIADYHNRLGRIEATLSHLETLLTQSRLERCTLWGIWLALSAGILWNVLTL